MKNKTALVLMELTVMLLVFALAAALCLRCFFWAENCSLEESRKDQAWLRLQSAAEILKHCRGDFSSVAQKLGGKWDGSQWIIPLDDNWNETEETPVFILRAVPEKLDTDYLGSAILQISEDGTLLAQLRICWQEVA